MITKLRQHRYLLFLIAIVLFSFFTKAEIPLMGDRGYYEKQLNHLSHMGTLWKMDLPLAIYLLHYSTILFGDFSTTYQLLILTFYSLFCLPIYWLSKKLYASSFSGLLSAIAISFNPFIIRMIRYGGFKSGLGHLLALLAVFSLYKLSETDKKHYLLLLTVFYTLTFVTHTMATGLLTMIILVYFLQRTLEHRKVTKYEWGSIILVASLFLAILILGFVWRATGVPIWFARYGKITRLFRVGFTGFAQKIKIDLASFMMISFTLAYSLLHLRKEALTSLRKDFLMSVCVVGVILYIIACITTGPQQELSYRFLQLMFLPFSLLIPYCIHKSELGYLILTWVGFTALL